MKTRTVVLVVTGWVLLGVHGQRLAPENERSLGTDQVTSISAEEGQDASRVVRFGPDRIRPAQTADTEPQDGAFEGSVEKAPGGKFLVYGNVTDPSGNPIAGAAVGHGSLAWTKTTQDGRYRLVVDFDERESFIIRYLRTGYAEVNAAISKSSENERGRREISVKMREIPHNFSVRGTVFDGETEVVAGHRVRIFSPELARQYVGTTDARGTFDLQGVRKGTYNLTVFSDGRFKRFTQSAIEIVSDVEIDVELESLNLGTMFAELVDSQGMPLRRITLDAYSDLQPERRHNVVTDDFGQFSLHDVADGLWTLQTRHAGFFRLTNIRHSGFVAVDTRLVLDIGGFEISGWVYDRRFNPVVDARVEVTRTENLETFSRSSRRESGVDTSGWFSIGGLATGAYQIRVSASGYLPLSESYEVGWRVDQPQLLLQRFPRVAENSQ